jgi:hypothetical protein
VDGIRGHEDNMCAAKKTLNKIWCKVSREYIKFPTFTKYQKTKKESSLGCNEYSNQQKTEYVLKNSSSLVNFFSTYTCQDLLQIFEHIEDEKLQLQ